MLCKQNRLKQVTLSLLNPTCPTLEKNHHLPIISKHITCNKKETFCMLFHATDS